MKILMIALALVLGGAFVAASVTPTAFAENYR